MKRPPRHSQRNPRIQHAGCNPWLVHVRRGSIPCAVQSMEYTNPCLCSTYTVTCNYKSAIQTHANVHYTEVSTFHSEGLTVEHACTPQSTLFLAKNSQQMFSHQRVFIREYSSVNATGFINAQCFNKSTLFLHHSTHQE